MKKKEILREKRMRIRRRGETWYQLDNAANLFPAISNERNTNVFRLSCDLNESVDPDFLQQALDIAIRDFSFFRVVMRRGLFWHYLEQADLNPRIHLEDNRPCAALFYRQAKELLFDVTYFGKTINLEMFHVLADGPGGFELLHAIVYHYLVLRHRAELPENLPVLEKTAPPAHMTADSFKHHYDPQNAQSPSHAKAYAITGTLLPSNSVQIISAQMPVKAILDLARANKVSLTSYLCALMICSIYTGFMPKRATKKTIAVNVPVDLRGHFASESARNFFGVVEVGYNFNGGEADFDAVLESVSTQLTQWVNADALAKRMGYTMSVQNNIFTGITPLFLKNLILKGAYHRSERATTCAISNLGRITMPEVFVPYIHSFHCLLNPTSLHRVKATVTSFGDILTLNFTSCIEETQIQRHFLRHLTQQGVDITITCNGRIGNEAM